MRTVLDVITLSVAAVTVAGSACEMNVPPPQMVECRVIGGEKLPVSSGGSEAFCLAIRHAAARQTPKSRVTVQVRVLGASTLTATVTADGHKLPEQEYSISDREFTRISLERFAGNLIGMVAGYTPH